MTFEEITVFLFGVCFLTCAFFDFEKIKLRIRSMKFDPDWIDFVIGSTLISVVLLGVLSKLDPTMKELLDN